MSLLESPEIIGASSVEMRFEDLTDGRLTDGSATPPPLSFATIENSDHISDADVTGLRVVDVDDDDPAFRAMYERCGGVVAYPMGARACSQAVIVYKDMEVACRGELRTLSAPLAAATMSLMVGGVVIGSAAVSQRFTLHTERAIVDRALHFREVLTGNPATAIVEFALAKQLYDVVALQHFTPSDYTKEQDVEELRAFGVWFGENAKVAAWTQL